MRIRRASQPNLIELHGSGTQVSYSTTSIAGVPLFHYRDSSHDLNFSGEQIAVAKTGLGRRVTGVLREAPGVNEMTFTLVLPDVVLREREEEQIKTFGVLTTIRGGSGEPVRGQVQSYRLLGLKGSARRVFF